jgi:hypothetical protein
MNSIVKTGAAVSLAGALALASATPTLARDWGRTAAAAGIGFAAGAVVGSALAPRPHYYGPTYAYEPAYTYEYDYGPSYSYGPVYSYEAPAYAYSRSWGSTRVERQMDRTQNANPGH